jgi:hypothetical protein
MPLLRPKKTDLPTSPVEYPSGVFIHTEKGFFFIHGEGKRMRCISKRVLDSWSPQRVIETSEAAVAKYRITSKIRFRNGSLIYSLADGKMYFISEGKRRHIVSPEISDRLGIRWRDAIWASRAEINLHEEGQVLE